MHVLMHLRADWREHRGGDVVQCLRWAAWLEALGAQVSISTDVRPDLRGVDLVHLTNLGRAAELLPTLLHARRYGTPVAFCPLYWPTEEFEAGGRPGFVGQAFGKLPRGVRQRAKAAIRWAKHPGQLHWWREIGFGTDGLARRFLESADLLIVTSQAEAEQIRRVSAALPPIRVVTIGVDAIHWSDDEDERRIDGKHLPLTAKPGAATDPVVADLLRGDERRGVLCVARFDPQKGQHRLIEALNGLDEPFTLLGPDNPNYPGYREVCRRAAGANVRLAGPQPPSVLKELYRRCRAHALVSWYETTGLTGLEAGCQGARAVVTDRGGVRDYYGEQAWYADPTDPGSMRRAVEAALAAPRTPDLAATVRGRFTWRKSAERLLRAHEELLGTRGLARRAA